MICTNCLKRKGAECTVLRGSLPPWGEYCTAFTTDNSWETKVNAAVNKYRAGKFWPNPEVFRFTRIMEERKVSIKGERIDLVEEVRKLLDKIEIGGQKEILNSAADISNILLEIGIRWGGLMDE